MIAMRIHQGIEFVLNSFRKESHLWVENKRLMAANARLTEKLATFDHLMQENILLRQAANVVPSLGERKFVSAPV